MHFPTYLQIEPSRSCNLSCVHCIHTGEKGILELNTYLTILNANPGCRYIKFQGLGEPLLNPYLSMYCRLAKERGAYVEVLTNGTIPICASLLQAVDLFGVSIETLDPDTYRMSRGAAIARVELTLDILATEYDGDVFINCTKTEYNTPIDIMEICEMAKANGWGFSAPLQEVWTPGNIDEIESAIRASGRHGETHEQLREPRCTWGTEKMYYDYRGNIHPCCIRMSDDYIIPEDELPEFLRTRATSDCCKTCPL